MTGPKPGLRYHQISTSLAVLLGLTALAFLPGEAP